MKRDWDLIRQILLAIEQSEPIDAIKDSAPEGLYEHQIDILRDSGLIEGFDRTHTMKTPSGVPVSTFTLPDQPRLTWEGHNFLDSVRDDDIWSKTKERISKVGGSISIDMLKTVATAFLTQSLGLQP